MAHKLVGDEECSFEEVAEVFDKEPLHTFVMAEWELLASSLGTPQNIVHKHKIDLNLDKLTYIDVIEELLQDWRLRNGKKATLNALRDIIAANFVWPQITDFLQGKIKKYANCWKDLDRDSKATVLNSLVEYQGNLLQLDSFASKIGENRLYEILDKTLTSSQLHLLLNQGQLRLDKFCLTKTNPFYISRILTLKRTLDKKVFQKTIHDIFIFENIQHHHLTILAKPELTDVSGSQVDELNVRFILLEDEDDFEQIAKLAIHPVHRIKYQDNEFYWVRSVGSVSGIKKFLLDECDEVCELDLTKKLSTFNNQPLAISATPGMGKSSLLTNLANTISTIYKDRIVMLLQFNMLLQPILSISDQMSPQNILKLLASVSSHNLLGEQLLIDLMSSSQSKVELFLDGFDEISVGDLNQVVTFLQILLKLPNIKIYVTTRPHLKNEVEDLVGFSSFNIAPFQKEDQIKYFHLFWKDRLRTTQDDKIVAFAGKVLEFLTPINEGQRSKEEFSGIPLQCFMLAEVYLEDAKRCLNYTAGSYELIGGTKSLFDLYTQFMDSKFSLTTDEMKIRKFCWREALDLLFSHHDDTVLIKEILNECTEENTTISWKEVYGMGIMEKNATDNRPAFVHRTFAEYFIADFIIKHCLTDLFVHEKIMKKFIYENLMVTGKSIKRMELKESLVKKVVDYVETSKFWENRRKDYSQLVYVLFDDSNVNLRDMKVDSLDDILIMWQWQLGMKATVDELLNAFNKIGWSELVDDLLRDVIEGDPVLYYSTICFFLNSALQRSSISLPATPQHSEVSKDKFCRKQIPAGLVFRMFTCAGQSYKYLTQFVFKLCSDFSQNNELVDFDNLLCSEYLLASARNDNLDFYKFVCDVVESVGCIKVTNISFPSNQIDEISYEHTPLHEAVKKGNYMLCEFLIFKYRHQLKNMTNLWQVCLYESAHQSRPVIKNKAKMLYLLHTKFSPYDLNDESLEDIGLSEVDAELIVTMFDICGYLPGLIDIKFIRMAVQNIVNDFQMDAFVDWALTKKLGVLLTHKFDNGWSVVWDAINRNVLNPGTLVKIYREFSFDLSIISSVAVRSKRGEALVKTIVDLSGNINLADSTQRTLLHMAAFFRKPIIINFLLKNGANVNLINKDEDTPLHYVFYDTEDYQSFYHIHECVHLLLEYNAPLYALNDDGKSAVSYAINRRHILQLEPRTVDLLNKYTPKGALQASNVSTHLRNVENLEVDKSLSHQRKVGLRCILA